MLKLWESRWTAHQRFHRNLALQFAQRSAFRRVETSLSGRCLKIVGRPSSPLAFDRKLVWLVSVLVYMLRLLHGDRSVLILLHGRSVSVRCGYRKRASTALRTPHHTASYNRKESSCCPAGIYSKVKHCLFNEARASGGGWGTNWFTRCRALIVGSFVLQIHWRSTPCRICFVSRSPESYELWLAVGF